MQALRRGSKLLNATLNGTQTQEEVRLVPHIRHAIYSNVAQDARLPNRPLSATVTSMPNRSLSYGHVSSVHGILRTLSSVARLYVEEGQLQYNQYHAL